MIPDQTIYCQVCFHCGLFKIFKRIVDRNGQPGLELLFGCKCEKGLLG